MEGEVGMAFYAGKLTNYACISQFLFRSSRLLGDICHQKSWSCTDIMMSMWHHWPNVGTCELLSSRINLMNEHVSARLIILYNITLHTSMTSAKLHLWAVEAVSSSSMPSSSSLSSAALSSSRSLPVMRAMSCSRGGDSLCSSVSLKPKSNAWNTTTPNDCTSCLTK